MNIYQEGSRKKKEKKGGKELCFVFVCLSNYKI